MKDKLSAFFLALLYGLVAYLPFQVALNLAPGIDLMSGRVLILGLFLVWLVKKVFFEKTSTLSFFKDQTGVALVLFFLLAAVSVILTDNPVWGARKLVVFVSLFPLYFLVQDLIKKKQEAIWLIFIMALGLATSSLISLAQFSSQFIFGLESVKNFLSIKIIPLFSGASFGALVVSNPSWLVEINGQTIMRAVGLFPDPHMLAFYLGLASPFALAAWLFCKQHRLVFFIAYGLSLVVLLLTFSRGGYLGLLFSLGVFLLFAWRHLGNKEAKLLGSSLALTAVILFLVGWPVVGRFMASFDLSEASNMGRLSIWQDSWSVIKKNPITGVGLGNYSLAISSGQGYRNAMTSHNLYLDLLAELGFFGGLAWLVALFLGMKKALEKIKQAPLIGLGTLASLSYFFVHSFFETAIFNPTALAFLMIALGLAAADLKEDVL